ncbi:hypothetical protein ACS0TY_023061 [Phlomoides rotata]
MYTATWPKEVRRIAADLLVNPVQVNIGNLDELVANKAITQAHVASIWITVNNTHDNSDYGKLEFNDFIGLKYMVSISAVSAGYALFAAVCSYLKCLLTKAWVFLVTDQKCSKIVNYYYITRVHYNGDRLVTWSEACASYSTFCNRLKIALALHVIAVCCFLVLAVISSYRVFRTFDPPLPPCKDDEVEQEMT